MTDAAISIGALAKATGTKVETIRWYERVGLLAAPARTTGNYRAYGPPHLARLSFIRRARDLGFSLDQVRVLLGLAEDQDRSCEAVDAIAGSTETRWIGKLATCKPCGENSTDLSASAVTAACLSAGSSRRWHRRIGTEGADRRCKARSAVHPTQR